MNTNLKVRLVGHFVLNWFAFYTVHADVPGIFLICFTSLKMHLYVTFYLKCIYYTVTAFFLMQVKAKWQVKGAGSFHNKVVITGA